VDAVGRIESEDGPGASKQMKKREAEERRSTEAQKERGREEARVT